MDTARLLVELGAVLLGLGVLAHLAGRVGLSPVPLYLLAGLAFGSGGIADIEAPEGFFESGSEIGVVLLLLLLGLEYSAPDLVDQLRREAGFGQLSTLFPEAKDVESGPEQMEAVIQMIAKMPTIGALAFRHNQGKDPVAPDPSLDYSTNILKMFFGADYEPDPRLVRALDILLNALPGATIALLLGWGWPSAVAMAGVTAVSSSGIVAKVLADLGRLGNRETPTVLGILVLEDLAMAVYLPVPTALLATTGRATTLRAIVLAVVVVAAVLVAALRHGHLVNRILPADAGSEVMLLGVFGLALLVAGLAQAVNVSAAVGAFLLGIALSGEVARRVRPLLEPLRDLFAAVFFVFFGLSTDPTALPQVLLPALGLAVAGAATKLATGWFAARRAGVGPAGRIRAGAALVPRGEFSIVVAGLAGSAVDPSLAPTAAAYVLLTAVLGPLMPRLTDPWAAAAARRASVRAG